MPTHSPTLNIPHSLSTVSVSVIETTSRIIAKTNLVVQPHILGHDEFNCPCYSFLVEHKGTGKKILFDLGIRKDPENLSPRTYAFTQAMSISSKRNVADILGDKVSEISEIIWSHHHFDHIGDPSSFPSSTNLVVGPGFKDEFLPGYPSNEESWIKESDYEGRILTEVTFEKAGLKLGQYDAVDYFGDGSFYLLDCLGIPSLISWEFRPNAYDPLPQMVDLPATGHHKSRAHRTPCPGSLFLNLHPKNSRTTPFYELINPRDSDTVREAMKSQRKLEEFDASDDVLVLTAHDSDAADIIDLYPKKIDEWKSKDWKRQLQWAFLNDFQVE
ncbi:hypothetical protein CLAIMM_10683 [Cladophialophora immunda]|nr:hypothetical protein CLAIMM_10683 [Cladophialophora immunda]